MRTPFKRLIPLLLLLALLSGCTVPTPTVAVPAVTNTDGLEVHYIDVGQADSMLLRCGEDSMLIDGGNVNDSSLLVSYLTEAGITTLNHVVCTHAHEDHVGGLAGALAKFTAEHVYSPVTEYDSKAFSNFVRYTEAQSLTITVPEVGDSWTLGEAVVTVLGPQKDYDDPNDTSIILRVDYGARSFLFTGDAELKSEDDMMAAGEPLEVDVLKVGHHGSRTSTGYLFLRTVNPSYAVISVGEDNDYGHPNDEVMSRLKDADVEVYRTDMQGTIIARTDGKTIEFTTNHNEYVDTNPADPIPGVYIGNKNSKVYHTPDCSSLPAEDNQVNFPSREAAESAGYKPCGRCDP